MQRHRRQKATTSADSLLVDPPRPSIHRTELPPGPSGLPIVGQAFRLRSDFVGLLQEAATYGDVSTASVNPILICLVNHPEPNRELLVNSHQKAERGQGGYGSGDAGTDAPDSRQGPVRY